MTGPDSASAATSPTPARRARTRERKQPNRLASVFYGLFPLLATAGVVFVLFIIGGKAVQGYEMRQEAKAVQQRVDQLHRENRQLTEQLQYYKSDTYIEKAAREDLGLVRPSDVPVVVAQPDGGSRSASPTPTPSSESPDRKELPTWQRWMAVFLDQEQ